MAKPSSTQLIALYVAAVGQRGASSGEIYARMCGDIALNTHQLVIAEFVRQEIMTVSGHFVTLTAKGQAMLAKITEAVLVS